MINFPNLAVTWIAIVFGVESVRTSIAIASIQYPDRNDDRSGSSEYRERDRGKQAQKYR